MLPLSIFLQIEKIMEIWGKLQSKNLTIYELYILENLLKIDILEVSKF